MCITCYHAHVEYLDGGDDGDGDDGDDSYIADNNIGDGVTDNVDDYVDDDNYDNAYGGNDYIMMVIILVMIRSVITTGMTNDDDGDRAGYDVNCGCASSYYEDDGNIDDCLMMVCIRL